MADFSHLVSGVAAVVIPTFVLKKGSGAGDYSTASVTYVDVDATNLAYTVMVPSGQKVLVVIAGAATVTSACRIALADVTTLLQEIRCNVGGVGAWVPFAITYVFTGDGVTHTFKLRYGAIDAAGTITINNATTTATPTMAFYLGPTN